MTYLLRLVAYGIFSIILSAKSAVVTVEGDNLTFTYDDSTLFGSANIVGNSIFFLPNNFSAQSVNDQGSTLSSDIVDVQIKVRDETIHLMDRFVLYESGDYKISDSTASVDVSHNLWSPASKEPVTAMAFLYVTNLKFLVQQEIL